ncbi:hypothetical protein ACLB2K_026995 [Fragaria x ananassa]
MLMEEELENRPCMLQDFLALQAAEKSLEDVLIQQYPPPTNPLLASSIELVLKTLMISLTTAAIAPVLLGAGMMAQVGFPFKKIITTQQKDQGAKKIVTGRMALKGGKGGSNGKRTVRKKKDDNREVRQHSSPYGDGNQSVAHYLANGLEERLAAAVPSFNPLCLDKMSAAVILKAYQTYIKACPFKLMSNIYANKTIFNLAEKATRLHIIDFGILYGYQWPGLIQSLAERPSGPPMLRVTGIEFPQSGFRPSESLGETGHRLAKYCKRFNVPFEYNFIGQDWETIRHQDIKLDRDELTVVNCLCRLRNLPEETEMNSPRNKVLKLIRRINPHVYIHGLVNGTYNTPFFTIRFQEALYHFSSMFDIFDETLPREDQQRLLYEQEILSM